MYGVRAQIGLLIPSRNATCEPEFNAMAPEGVSVHAARLLMKDYSLAGLKKMEEDTDKAAETLAGAGVNIIAYACTSGSLAGGFGSDREIIKRIEGVTGIPATTTSTAVIAAFRELGIQKTCVASPYDDEINGAEKTFFEAHGIKVLRIKGLDIHGEQLRKASPQATFDLACEVDTPEADSVFISCTNFKSITVIEKLEEKLGKPVFSSNTATMWYALKTLGIRDAVKGYGRLFAAL